MEENGDAEPVAEAAVAAVPATAPSDVHASIGLIVTASLSGFTFGYDMCITASALRPLAAAFELSELAQQAVVAMVMLGAACGAALGGPLSDAVGRRPMLGVAAGMFVLGAITLAAAPHLAVVLVGRWIIGCGIGVSSVTATVYLAEVAAPARRGLVVGTYEVALCIGCLVAFVAGASLANTAGGWRWMLGLAAVPAGIQGLLMRFAPESQLWLVQRSERGHSRLIDWWTPMLQHKRAALLAVGVGVAQNAAFSNAMLYYINDILAAGGTQSPEHFAIIVAGMKLIGVLVGMALLHRFPRRSILSWGTLAEAGALLLLTCASAGMPDGAGRTGVLVTGLSAFVLAWNASWAPLMFVVCSEIVPLQARAAAMGLCVCMYWTSSILTNAVTLTLTHALGFTGFMGTLTVMALAPLMLIRVLPETFNKDLHAIASELQPDAGRDAAVRAHTHTHTHADAAHAPPREVGDQVETQRLVET